MMKRSLYLVIISCFSVQASAQILVNDSASLFLNSGTSMSMRDDTQISGRLHNEGNMFLNRDLQPGANRRLGKLVVTGNQDQFIHGDSLEITKLSLRKSGILSFTGQSISITDSLNIQSGILNSQRPGNIRILGAVSEGSDDGYLLGNLVRVSRGEPLIFPMGINGSYNEIEVSNIPPGDFVIVQCDEPDSILTDLPDGIAGVAQELEWIIRTSGNPVDVQVAVKFSGVDLRNQADINADSYEPALIKLSPGDTAYTVLDNSFLSNTDLQTFGEIESAEDIYVSDGATRIKVALIPVLAEPILYLPNAFSPNAMFEENRLFRPFFSGAPVSSVRITVWDAYRNEIFSFSETGDDLPLDESGWDGFLSNGQVADEGIYYFTVSVRTNTGQLFQETGSFLLSN